LSAAPAPRFGIEKAVTERSRIRQLAYRYLGEIHVPGRIRMGHVLRAIASLSLAETGVRFCDAGTGRGDIALHMARCHPAWQIDGLEVLPDRIDRCRQAAKTLGLSNVRFETFDLLTMTARSEYDLIVNSDVLEHIERDDIALANLCNALKPSGYLVLTFPSTPQPKHLAAVKWREQRLGITIADIGHVREGYSPERIRSMLAECEMECLTTRYTYGRFGTLAFDIFFVLGDSKPNALVFALEFPLLLALSFLEARSHPKHGAGLLVVARKPGARQA
jgi:2-polyprenyl-3-methyl-5-hydroxy-6-metoxy-1,4-benzoquinol methylase